MAVKRRDVDFESGGTRCAAWLYEPDDVADPPVIVMAHGLGGHRTARLPAFAERFADLGFAVLLFDYRRWGDSDGEPRRVISPSMQVTDWQAAVGNARSLDAVDGERVGLWGTSFSGGHVLTVAARDGDVDAVVAQVPFTDGLRNALHLVRQGGLDYARAASSAFLRDAGRWLTRREPNYVPVVAEPESFGVLNTPGAKTGYESLVPADERETWDNEVAARFFLAVQSYRPVAEAGDVDCPVFVAQATEDRIIPAAATDAAVDALDDVERVRYPIGHFDAYTGADFERIVGREGEFFEHHLR
ncbi:MAG: alpha/beta hydrolase [Haloarculaceae archaeon]